MPTPAKKKFTRSISETDADASTKNQALQGMMESMKAASAVDVAGVQSNQSIFKTFADCMEATARSGRSDAFVERLQSKVEAAFHEAIKQNNNAMERSHYSLKGVVVAMAAVVGIGAYVLYQLPKGTKGED